MPLLLVLQRDSWLLLFQDQTSTWLSSSSHVTEKIYCNIFKYRFCFALVLQLCYRGGRAMFDNAFILFILGLSKLEWISVDCFHCLWMLLPPNHLVYYFQAYMKLSREYPRTCLASVSKCNMQSFGVILLLYSEANMQRLVNFF